jgi:hypothetical protein
MPQTIRSRNLDLIRWLNYGHEIISKKLSHITNPNYVSMMATGDMEISERRARLIEKAVELPAGWIDRDNISILKMSPGAFPKQDLLTVCARLSLNVERH